MAYEVAKLILHREEHGVFRSDGYLPHFGDYLSTIPGLIYPSTICYPAIHVIDSGGTAVDFVYTSRDRE